MRTLYILAILGALALVPAACGGDRDVFVAQTLSDQRADGDIVFSPEPPPNGTYTISQADATGNVIFGIAADASEYRAFLTFPLDGSIGGDTVPLGAVILSADIEVFVTDVGQASTVPTLVELVPYPITGLTSTDFDSLPIATRGPFDFFRSDVNAFVRIDVTPLMVEAQHRRLLDLQLRFLLDFVPGVLGLIEIDDDLSSRAPLLTVSYR